MLFRPKQPNFSVFERHAELTECVRVDWEDRVPSSSPDLNPLDYHMLEKYNKLQPKPKTTRELKALADPLEKNCHKSTSTRRWQTSFSVWLPTWLWLRMVVTPCICSSSVRLQVRILTSSPINKLVLSRAINKLPVKTTLGMPRDGGCLGWNSIILSLLPRCIECRRGLAMRILSVSLSVCQTRALWQNGRKICPDFYTTRKII